MNAENPSQAKFKIVRETQLPHMCIACRLPSDGQMEFIDLGLSLDTEDPLFIGVPDFALGVMYLCINCAREIALVTGSPPLRVVEQFTNEVQSITEEADLLRRENERLRRLNESYINVLSSLGAIDAGDSSDEDKGSGSPVSEKTEHGLTESASK
jgi:hypothetical protein